jgi:sugar phosphate isomerase/epimerase
MKLSFMTFACPDWNALDVVDGALTYGYDGVELRVEGGHRHGLELDTPVEKRREIGARFADAGLELPCIATSLRFAKAGELGRQECERALRLMDLAADAGSPALRVFGGQPEQEGAEGGASAESDIAREDAIAWAIENLQSITDQAQARGVSLWFETHDFFRLGRDTAAVVRGVHHPAVRCNWDVMHPQLNGEAFAQTKEYLNGLIAHTHFHDAKTSDPKTICAFGEGSLPLLEMLRWLQNGQKFNGFLSAEYFDASLGASPDESLPLWADGCRELLRQLR